MGNYAVVLMDFTKRFGFHYFGTLGPSTVDKVIEDRFTIGRM